jgi:hypothetical protein
MPAVTAPTEFILWFRAGRGRWRPVAFERSYDAALDQIGIGGRRHGSWLVLPNGDDPNVKPSPPRAPANANPSPRPRANASPGAARDASPVPANDGQAV